MPAAAPATYPVRPSIGLSMQVQATWASCKAMLRIQVSFFYVVFFSPQLLFPPSLPFVCVRRHEECKPTSFRRIGTRSLQDESGQHWKARSETLRTWKLTPFGHVLPIDLFQPSFIHVCKGPGLPAPVPLQFPNSRALPRPHLSPLVQMLLHSQTKESTAQEIRKLR